MSVVLCTYNCWYVYLPIQVLVNVLFGISIGVVFSSVMPWQTDIFSIGDIISIVHIIFHNMVILLLSFATYSRNDGFMMWYGIKTKLMNFTMYFSMIDGTRMNGHFVVRCHACSFPTCVDCSLSGRCSPAAVQVISQNLPFLRMRLIKNTQELYNLMIDLFEAIKYCGHVSVFNCHGSVELYSCREQTYMIPTPLI